MSVLYTYPPKPFNGMQLYQEILAALLPAPSVEPYAGGAGEINIPYEAELLPAEKGTLDDVVAVHVPAPARQTRTFDAILQDYNGLSGANRSKIYTDLTDESPPKWSLSVGPNKAALPAFYFLSTQPGGAPASVDLAKSYLATAYVQDYPTYLVNNPEFPGVTVPGDEPVPS